MVQELSDETYKLVKKEFVNCIPKIIMINGDKNNILDYYRGGEECNYLNFYKKKILIEPRTPSLINKNKNTILLETSKKNPHNIEITSIFEQVNCSCSTARDYNIDDKNSTIELNIGDFSKFRHYFTVIFNFVEKGKTLNTIYDFSLHIKLFLDNPLNYNSENYLDHDNIKVIYYSKNAYKPYEEHCICDIEKLGTYKCSFKKYLSIKSKKEYMEELSNYMFDIKNKITEGEYLNMQNILLNLHKYY